MQYRVEDYRPSDVAQLPNIGGFCRVGLHRVPVLDANPTAEQPTWTHKMRESNPIPSMVHTTPRGRKPRIRKGGRPTYVEIKTFSELSTREREGLMFMRVGFLVPTTQDREAASRDVAFNPGEHENRPLFHVSVVQMYRQEHPDCTL